MICVKGAPWQRVVVSHLLSGQPCALCLACLLVHKGLSSQLGVCGACSLLERDGSFLFLAASLCCQLQGRGLRGPFLSSANTAGVPALGGCPQAVLRTWQPSPFELYFYTLFSVRAIAHLQKAEVANGAQTLLLIVRLGCEQLHPLSPLSGPGCGCGD